MNYREAIQYMRQIQKGDTVKPGLDMTKRLMEYLGNPQNKLHFVHIAGTNGKGSTAAFISSIYAAHGLKVGRYASPAVFSEFEKIQYVYGEKSVYITEEEMAEHITHIRRAIEKMQKRGEGVPTEFEIETAAAFLAFARWNCDLVVLEAGMGGRLDATNIVTTVQCAVITPVSMDHMKFLGSTIEEIAYEKAGIIKRHIPVVVYQHDERAQGCLAGVCREQECKWSAVSDDDWKVRKASLLGTVFDYKRYRELRIRMPGLYQVENACLAIECVEAMNSRFPVSEEQLRKGLARAVWRGRFDVYEKRPVVVMDGAHNPDGIQHFLESVHVYFENYQKVGIVGIFADKDYADMARRIGDTFDQVYTVTPPTERGLPAEKLAEQIRGHAVACASIQEAVELGGKKCEQLACSGEEQGLFIFGSLSILKSAAEWLGLNELARMGNK